MPPSRPVGERGDRWRAARGCRCPSCSPRPPDVVARTIAWMWHVLQRGRVVDREVPSVAADGELALPDPVAPLRVPVADAEHLEVEQRLEADRRRFADPRDEVDLEPLPHTGCRASTRCGSRSARIASGSTPSPVSTVGDDAGLVPAPAVEQLVDVEVGRERLEVDRRPQPEELRVGDRRTGGTAFADRAHAPRAVARSPRLAGCEVDAARRRPRPSPPSRRTG